LEHLLIQHLTAFFNVGEHNHCKLEGADWNDGMDMAPENGESVAFSALYTSNLRQIAQLINALQNSGVSQVKLAKETFLLLDSLQDKVDYNSVPARQKRLDEYFSAVAHTISGEKITLSASELQSDLIAKADWMTTHIRNREWLSSSGGYGWFNGYYDNDGHRLEGERPHGIRMTLTGQVFTLMGGVATDEQVEKIIQSVDHYLFDPGVGGYRLNTDFGEVLLNMGRCFGFAYGHKENGAMFSHMAVMYAYALYQRGYIREAYKVLQQIYTHSVNFPVSRMYPGIPEYFNARGRGVYTYLTGSASWYLLTLLTQSFGVRGELGDLILAPKLVKEQFDAEGKAGVRFFFADRELLVLYENSGRRDYGAYKVGYISIDGHEQQLDPAGNVQIARQQITGLKPGKIHEIYVRLVGK
jgi:cellobiose phosphorylase